LQRSFTTVKYLSSEQDNIADSIIEYKCYSATYTKEGSQKRVADYEDPLLYGEDRDHFVCKDDLFDLKSSETIFSGLLKGGIHLFSRDKMRGIF
jgi:hypothetical protein